MEVHIGNRSDALALLEKLLEKKKLDKAVKEALEALRQAIEREIV